MCTVKIIGQGSFFGEEEIVKDLKTREGTAVCKGQHADIYAIEKKVIKIYEICVFDR